MSTLGWPEETPDLKRYFPTSVLATAKDIIFFWVARMNFASLEMTGELPYRDVYINPTVLDERGATMSKVKGNGIDPLAVIDGATREELSGPVLEARPDNMKELLARVEKNFPQGFEGVGADALRFTLVHGCSEGQEIRLSLQRFHDIGRRFVTKLWNASRYALSTLASAPGPEAGAAPPAVEDRWILSRTASAIAITRRAVEEFDFGSMAQELYRFVWNDYCDWYLELTKPRITGDDPKAARRAAHVLGTTLAQILRMLHPVTPFITEELWSMLLPAMDAKDLWMGKRPSSDLLILERTAVAESAPDSSIESRFEALQRLVGKVRTSRANARLAENVRLSASVRPLDEELRAVLSETASVVSGLANLASLSFVDAKPEGAIAFVDPSFELYLDLGKHVDVGAERKRIDREIAEIRAKLEQVAKKLDNPRFLAGAKPEVVEEQRARDLEYREILGKLEEMKREYESP
jgi:valyl-tRNA synthetase